MALCIKTCLRKLATLLTLGLYTYKPYRKPSLFFLLINEAFVSVKGNRLRACLAMLGIIIGVGSVIVMLAIGRGSQKMIEQSINALGTNQLVIRSQAEISSERRSVSNAIFTSKDVAAIEQLPNVVAAAATAMPSNSDIAFEKVKINTPIIGTTPNYFIIRNLECSEGAPFSNEDVHTGKHVVALGKTIADQLFHDSNPLNRIIMIDKIPFRVACVLQPKGSRLDGTDQDKIAIMPISSVRAYIITQSFTSTSVRIELIYVQAVSGEVLNEVMDDITNLLRQRFKLREMEANSFTISNLTAVKQVAAETNGTFTLLLAAIASISLLVGSIGIMNIMMVTVTERTREIGIRKAIGANKKHILMQFLMEASMLSTAGSIGGLVLGFGTGLAAEYWADIPVEFSPLSVILSLTMAIAIGIASGLFPAWKAAKMQAIDALRTIGG